MSAPRPKTGLVLLNLGGPETLADVEPFLRNLFLDREIIRLPFQSKLGPFIARKRAPRIQKLYDAIGGGSPIRRLTEAQARGLEQRLDALSPETGPHKAYLGFRYAPPFAEDALRAMARDGVTRAVAFSQYPQYSCTTTGSSLNDLWATARRLGLENAFQWSIIDRWPKHPAYVEALAETVREGLERFAPEERDEVLVLFSAHSLPVSVIERGDAYQREIETTVRAVMDVAGIRNRHRLSYQSKVGPIKWLGPQTDDTLQALPKEGITKVLVCAVAFTTDHIETLSEIDIEYGELAHHAGIQRFERTPALNDRPAFLDAIAELAAEHLSSGRRHSAEYGRKCRNCANPAVCRRILNPVSEESVTAPVPSALSA